MVTSGKKTKKTHESVNNRLALVMKCGKYTLGYKTLELQSKEKMKKFTGKLILISDNCSPLRKSEIEYYAMLAIIIMETMLIWGQLVANILKSLALALLIQVILI